MRIGANEPSRSLSRQSVLVAAVCTLTDSLLFLMTGCGRNWPEWAALAAVVLVDAALAGPARHSGVLAALHGLVQMASPLLMVPGNDAGLMIAGYRAGAWLSGWQAWTALGVLVITRVATQLLYRPEVWRLWPVAVLTGAVLPWLVGRYTTARRAYLAELEQRAEREQRDAEQAMAEAIARERSAIARDLHDVIAHHVSAINLHAGAARLSLTPGAAAAAGSLHAVESASQAAMVDLRHLLDLLHGDNGDGARQPGLANLDELLDGVRAAGIPARLRRSGQPRAVPDSLGITLYRIIQEMLTNALRHGDSGGVDVELEFRTGALEVRASNTMAVRVSRDPESGGGRGLAGIRSRAGMFDGVATYGVDPDGRTWSTSVTFPLGVRG
ncbi:MULTISPECIES: sensor histidine kinase [unclassified Crossiella]|uniref:sensor histidine kinase n=1 Tax=unclassified Crossiella TaxID=2620835 RepID=UPI001FFE4B4B|nr:MULTISPECIES: histidine kinase [unclassified Crossiella]MCK2245058.1 histidine kinase [Crossiella sp. S99.2]MCK2258639.1 histidine kinase [Crossiella sp. S99.1]